MGLLQSAPAVPLFLAALTGAVVAVQFKPTSSHLSLAMASLAVVHWLVRQGFLRRRLPLIHGWLLLLTAVLATYHMSVMEEWHRLLPEGDGVWQGRLFTSTSVDGAVQRTLRISDWQGRGRPRLQLVESEFHEPLGADVWERIPEGAQVTVVGTLRHPRPSGNPGEFNYASYLFRQGVAATVYVQDVTLAHAARPAHHRLVLWAKRVINFVRGAIVGSIQRAASPEAASVLIAMTTGGRELLSEETELVFRRTGTSHLLAVSGLHVGMIGSLALFLVRLTRLGSLGRYSMAMGAVWGFVVLSGARPSSLRAGITATLGLLVFALRRKVEPLQLWAISGVLLIVAKPLLACDVGFQLSYAATGSILLWLRALQPRLEHSRWTHRVAMGCLISLAAQAGTAPIVAFYFHELSISGVFVNWIAVPLAAPVLYLTVIGLLIGFISPAVGDLLVGLAGLLLDRGLAGLSAVAAWPWTAVEVAAPPALLAAAYGLLLCGAPLALQKGEPPSVRLGKRAVTVGLVLTMIAVWMSPAQTWTGGVHITFIDVGQGDAILIRTPKQKAILIDGGGSPRRGTEGYYDVGARRVVPYLQHIGVRRLDMVVNTHPDEDHLQGLLAVLSTREVGMVIDSGQTAITQTYREYRELLDGLHAPYHAARRGDVIDVEEGIVLHVLGPKADVVPTSLNNGSVVLRLETPYGSVLLPGDLERSGQQELLWEAENVTLDALVIKVPHHGSARDVDWRFIDAVGPQVAVFQVGRNGFGHPSPQALAAYAERGAQVFRNDVHGAITVSLTRRGIRVHTHR